ncbi:MAG: motility protein A [candidate division Zixibacteria bacterium]|nr:motility protein A [candidate division Zixibacteria bacterium]
MDIATIIGLIVGISAVIIAFLMEGGHLSALFHIPALILVVFGTIGAATVTTSIRTVLNVPALLRVAFTDHSEDLIALINKIVSLAEKARREGILGLEDNIAREKNPVFKKAVQLVIDGTEATLFRNIIETEIAYISQRHGAGILFFQKLGGFSPTLGIVGTVLGLIHALSQIEDASKIAVAIAGAFVATLWGISLANLCYLPIADKLRFNHQEETKQLELILEGMLSIQSGENPKFIRNKLLSYITPQKRNEL